jgi:arylsulfatase A-like enzyme
LLEWPARVKPKSVTDVPACTSDYFPTVLDLLKTEMPDNRPTDGVSLLPLIEGRMALRSRPIAFESGKQVALVDNRYKLITQDSGRDWRLFDLIADASETSDVAAKHPDIVSRMRSVLEAWRKSCTESREGKDY